MYLHDQSQKTSHLGNYMLYLNFIDPLQNHCLFYQSAANIVQIFKITTKEIVYNEYQLQEKINK